MPASSPVRCVAFCRRRDNAIPFVRRASCKTPRGVYLGLLTRLHATRLGVRPPSSSSVCSLLGPMWLTVVKFLSLHVPPARGREGGKRKSLWRPRPGWWNDKLGGGGGPGDKKYYRPSTCGKLFESGKVEGVGVELRDEWLGENSGWGGRGGGESGGFMVYRRPQVYAISGTGLGPSRSRR